MKRMIFVFLFLSLTLCACSSHATPSATAIPTSLEPSSSQQSNSTMNDFDVYNILSFSDSTEIVDQFGEYITIKLYFTNNGDSVIKMVHPYIKLYGKDGATICVADGTFANAVEPGEKVPIDIFAKVDEEFSDFKVVSYEYQIKPLESGINYVMLDLVMESISFGKIS